MRGSLRQRSPGTWQLRWQEQDPTTGRWKSRGTTFRGTKRQADAELAKIVDAINDGAYVAPSKTTLREYLTRWLRDYVDVHVDKAGTRDTYAMIVRAHLTPALGAIALNRLTAARVQEYYRAKLADGLASSTVRLHHLGLHRALEVAVRWGLVARNVCDAVQAPKKRRGEMRTWTPAEAGRFLDFARAEQNRYYPLFAAAIFTGLRLGELLGLRWQDVDLDGGAIAVVQTLERSGREPRFGSPKTAKGRRTLPIPPELVAILRAWKAKQNEEKLLLGPDYRPYGLVFTIAGGGPVNRGQIGRHFLTRLSAQAGVPRIRFHDLRHTSATLMLGANVNPKVVSERLGHGSVAITLDVYSHVLPTMQRDAANVLGKVVGHAVGA